MKLLAAIKEGAYSVSKSFATTFASFAFGKRMEEEEARLILCVKSSDSMPTIKDNFKQLYSRNKVSKFLQSKISDAYSILSKDYSL